MKKTRSFVSLGLAAVLLAGTLSACTNNNSPQPKPSDSAKPNGGEPSEQTDATADFKELKLTVLYDLPNLEKVREDKLTSIWRDKTKITLEFVSEPEGVDPEQYIQMLTVGNNLPDIIVKPTYTNNEKIIETLVASNKLYDYKLEDIKTYMPNYVARIEELGATVEDVYEANRWKDGNVYKGAVMFDYNQITSFPALRDDDMVMQNVGDVPYSVYFRDDILTAIYPNARTEQQLRELYEQKGGKLTLDDYFGDIPIYTLEDMYDYLKKVKELDVKVGNKSVIPGQLTSSSDGSSLSWSLLTAFGQYWYGLWGMGYKGDQVNFPMAHPDWKEYMRFFNRLYNEGLSDREGWIAKSEQINAKAINGEYAVMHYWLPVQDAREVAKKEDRGYGYRLFPLFNIPRDNKYQDLNKQPISLTASNATVLLTKNIKEEDLAQIFHWLDWNVSKEAKELRYWGPPEFYTGDGLDRRFKPEYKDIETMYLTGTEGGKDLFYYGMFPNIVSGGRSYNPEVYMLDGYPGYEKYMPQNVYPKVVTKDANIDNEILLELRKETRKDAIYYKQDGWTLDELDGMTAWNAVAKKAYSAEAGALIVKAIVAKPDNFDKEYNVYYNTLFGPPFQEAFAEVRAKWKEIYDTKVEPEIKKAMEAK